MEDDRGARRWRVRTLAVAAALHAAVLFALLRWPGRFEMPRAAAVVETTIWSPTPTRVTRAPARPEPAIAVHVPPKPATGSTPTPPTEPPPVDATTPPPAAITLVPRPPVPAASAPPLRLDLSHEQLRALEAGTPKTLAQLVPGAPRPSSLQQLGGEEDGVTEIQLPGGITEVHSHGGCFRLVPTARSQLDPFNPGPRLTGPCLGNF